MSAEKKIDLSGAQRAAVLLLALGEENASEVLRHLSAHEVQLVGSAMTQLIHISREQIGKVLETFTEIVINQKYSNINIEEYTQRIFTKALGEERALDLINNIKLERNGKGLESLRGREGRIIAEMMEHEHPQIIAIVLAHLQIDQAAEVVAYLPKEVRADVVIRLASLDSVSPAALRELDQMLERQFSNTHTKFKVTNLGGIKLVANILNAMNPREEREVLTEICAKDADLSQHIQEQLFVFDNLFKLDERSIQALLREISGEQLVIALKGVEPVVCEKIFAHLSKRAADILRDDLEVKGPVHIREIAAAQKEILDIARRMSKEGLVNLHARKEDDLCLTPT